MAAFWMLVPFVVVAVASPWLRRPEDDRDPMWRYWRCPCGAEALKPWQLCKDCEDADWLDQDDEYRRRIDV